MKLWKYINEFYKDNITSFILMIPIITAFLIIVIMNKYSTMLYGIWPKERVDDFSIGLVMFAFGLCPVIMIVRKEAPLIFKIKGTGAVFIGAIFTLVFLFLGLIFIIPALY